MAGGRLPQALPEAAQLLDSPLRREAQQMLERCTGQSFGTNRARWAAWLEARRERLRVRLLGLVVEAPDGPLKAEDVLVTLNGRPFVHAGELAAPPLGPLALVRKHKVLTVTPTVPPQGLKVYPSYVVFLDGKAISGGEIERHLEGVSVAFSGGSG